MKSAGKHSALWTLINENTSIQIFCGGKNDFIALKNGTANKFVTYNEQGEFSAECPICGNKIRFLQTGERQYIEA